MTKNALEQLRALSVIVADSGDIEAIARLKPQDATTNPSLLLKAVGMPSLSSVVSEAIASAEGADADARVADAADRLAVAVGKEILSKIEGRVSTEVDARLSYDKDASIAKAKHLIAMYEAAGVSKDRILIKLASTWEGIQAAKALEAEGINTNLTLLFNIAQARASADAGVFLISPFVGRILDWHLANGMSPVTNPSDDPGVKSVTEIWNFYKQHGVPTVVMGASFRNTGQILALAGCDRLTISPDLLDEMAAMDIEVPAALTFNGEVTPLPTAMTEDEFRAEVAADPMASEKLKEGIDKFAADQVKLEELIRSHEAFVA